MMQYIFSAVTSANNATNIFDSSMEFGDFLLLSISIIILFAWIFSIMYILRWGVLLILSGWKDDKIKPAINSIRYALIWLTVIVASIFIFPRVAWLLWLDASKYSSPERIFTQIKSLWDKILKTNWSDTYISPSTSWNVKDSTLPSNFSDL